MPDLRDLYQEVILEHSKSPRNFRAMETATAPRKVITRSAVINSRFTCTLKTIR